MGRLEGRGDGGGLLLRRRARGVFLILGFGYYWLEFWVWAMKGKEMKGKERKEYTKKLHMFNWGACLTWNSYFHQYIGTGVDDT